MAQVLILASEREAAVFESALGWSGIDGFADDPLARQSRGKPRGLDHVMLARANETNLVRWMGRSSSGYFHGFGPVMKIVVAEGG